MFYPKPDDDLCEPLIDNGFRIHEVIYHNELNHKRYKYTYKKRPFYNAVADAYQYPFRISIIAEKNLSEEEYREEKKFYLDMRENTRKFKMVVVPYQLKDDTGGNF